MTRPLFGLAIGEPWKYPIDAASKKADISGAQRWHNWGPYGMEDWRNWPAVYFLPFGQVAELRRLAEQYPGRTWLVGNEPEYSVDSLACPHDAARAWSRLKARLGKLGSMAIPGWTVGKSNYPAWWNLWRQYGGFVPDRWHIHCYASTLGEWRAYMDQWWRWYERNGEGRPVIISECGTTPDIYHYLRNEYDDSRVEAVFWLTVEGSYGA